MESQEDYGEKLPDAQINRGDSLKYWNSVSADVGGMLGGYPQLSRIDLRGSHNFLTKLRRLAGDTSSQKLHLGVDCGAGIGRITEGFLSNVCETVDIVEPVEKFANVLKEGQLKKEGKVGDVHTIGLESWTPTKTYDLIWTQWCVGHLTDAQMVKYLERCGKALSPGGWIVVKENLSTHRFGEDLFDDVDSSVTRSDQKFRDIFEEAKLKLVRSELQTGFPKGLGLYPVKMYALKPSS